MSETPITVYVVKRTGRAAYVMRYADPFTGRWVERSTGETTKKAAEKAAAVWEDELRSGRWAASARMRWADFCEFFLSEATSDMRPATVGQYVTTFNALDRLCPLQTVADLTTQRVLGFANELRKKRTVKRDGVEVQEALSQATVARHLRHLRAVARWAHHQGILAKVPAFNMPKGGAGVHRMKGRPITGEEVQRMLDACEAVVGATAADSWRLLIRGLYATGLRISEAAALRWDHQPGCVHVRLAGRRSVLEFDASAQKNATNQTVPLAPEAVRLLEPLAAPRGFVFRPLRMDGTGEPMARDSHKWSIVVARIGRQARVVTDPEKGRTASAHDLRRGFGYRWSRRVMPAQLMALMRHASMATTMTYYVGSAAESTAAELWAAEDARGGDSCDMFCDMPAAEGSEDSEKA